jgi:DNA-binding transcriptional LysR family regulator
VNSDWLEDFLALAEAGGFSRAAEKRYVSQPNLSRRIMALEEWAGATLVDRSSHTISLTPAGEAFLPIAQDLMRQLHQAQLLAQEVAEANHQKLKFAATHVLALTFFPVWLREIEVLRPINATIELTSDHMVACEDLMLGGHVQYLICHHHEDAPVRLNDRFRSVPIGSDRLIPVAAPSLLSSCATDELPRLEFSSESGMGRILASSKLPERRGQVIFVSHLSSVLTAMARSGRGVSWSPLSQVAEDLERGTLQHAEAFGPPIDIEIRLWRHKSRMSSTAESLWHGLQSSPAASDS